MEELLRRIETIQKMDEEEKDPVDSSRNLACSFVNKLMIEQKEKDIPIPGCSLDQDGCIMLRWKISVKFTAHCIFGFDEDKDFILFIIMDYTKPMPTHFEPKDVDELVDLITKHVFNSK